MKTSDRIILLFLCLLFAGTGSCHKRADAQGTPVYTYEIVNTYPHRSDAFTQGLIFYEGFLYEGTGGLGTSRLAKIELKTGKILQQIHLAKHLWGEGLTLLDDRFYQLTYKAGLGFIYDRDTLQPQGQFKYPTEGWGLTHNGIHLIKSDGSERLTFHDPNGFALVKTVPVHDGVRPVTQLNELEYFNDHVYANIWQTEQIAEIDPNNGQVTAWIDLSGLKAQHPRGDVLNGIAYDPEQDRLFVTGKWWSKLYEIKLIKK